MWLGFFVDSFAQDVIRRPGSLEKSVQILNDPPFIESFSISDHEQALEIRTFVPAENMNGFLYVYGTVNDGNGCEDILNKDNWSLTVYRSSVEAGSSCTSDARSCYHAQSLGQLTVSNCEGTGDTHISYQWRIPLAHYIEPTDKGQFESDTWHVDMKVLDDSQGAAVANSSFEVATLRAISVDRIIDYGEIDLGAESLEKKMIITNTGNDPVDLDVRVGGALVCEKGVIPAKNIHIGLREGFSFEKPDLTLSENDQWLNFSLPKRVGAGLSQKAVYFKLKAPESEVHGQCKNEITFTATSDR